MDEHRELDFKLNPASVQTNVEVTATAVAVQTSDATLGQVVTSQEVADLPLNGRDFVQLATLTAGVTQETNPNSFFNGGASSEVSARGSYSLSVGGSRASSTDWLLDGNDNNELTAGGIAILSSIDSIQEFKVLTYNYSAEWGTRAGPTVLVTTKTGSDQLHGTVFEFFRNTYLDARSFFASEHGKIQSESVWIFAGRPHPVRTRPSFLAILSRRTSVTEFRLPALSPRRRCGPVTSARCVWQSQCHHSDQSVRDSDGERNTDLFHSCDPNGQRRSPR